VAELVDGADLAQDLAVAGVLQERRKLPSAASAAGEDELGQLYQGDLAEDEQGSERGGQPEGGPGDRAGGQPDDEHDSQADDQSEDQGGPAGPWGSRRNCLAYQVNRGSFLRRLRSGSVLTQSDDNW
jgi:hypothetical protein